MYALWGAPLSKANGYIKRSKCMKSRGLCTWIHLIFFWNISKPMEKPGNTLFWLFSFWGLLVGMTHQFPIWKVIYRLLGVQVNVGDRWGAVKHYFIRWTWFTDFSKTKSTLLGTNLQTWSVQVKMLLTNLLTWRVLQTWRVQVNEE